MILDLTGETDCYRFLDTIYLYHHPSFLLLIRLAFTIAQGLPTETLWTSLAMAPGGANTSFCLPLPRPSSLNA